jgi:quinol monooxygenase YgiN
MNYVLINKMTTKSGKRQQVIDIMLEAGKAFNNNPSCLLYLVSTSKDEPDVIWVQDIWTNKEDHEAAMQSDKMVTFIKQAIPLLKAMPEQFQVEPMGGKSSLQ